MNIEVAVFIFDVDCMISVLFWPALFCLCATNTSNYIENIGDEVYDPNWSEYPVEQQKYVILLIACFRKSNYFTGLYLIRCTLEVFGTVSGHFPSIFLSIVYLICFFNRSFEHLVLTI